MVMQAAGETVTAVNAAAGVNKLLQISAGAAYTDNQEVITFDLQPTAKRAVGSVGRDKPQGVSVCALPPQHRHHLRVFTEEQH
jgi:hypothetical protein